MKKTPIEKLNEELKAMGVEEIKDVDPCPERTKYYAHLHIDIDDRKDDWNKKFKFFREKYLSTYYKVVAEKYPHLLYEKTNDKVYWNYNEETGVYDELSFPEVRNLIIAMLIDEDFTDKANESFAKSTLNKYRSTYRSRGHFYDDFGSEDDLFHANNGWVNLKTLEYIPHTPDILSRRKSAVDYDANAICPIYDKFLDQDIRLLKEEVRVIDQFSGALLTPDIRYQKILTVIGKPGSGKSTVVNVWNNILGSLATRKSLTQLSGDSFRFVGSSLIGKHLCWFDEVDIKRSEMSTNLGNLVTATDIRIERKGIDGEINARNTLKCVLTANRLPMSSEDGSYRRMLLIYFNNSFTDEGTTDPDILDKMVAEASGILNRMIKGLIDLRKMNGFTMIPGHADRIEEYKAASDPISGFLDEYFVADKNGEIPSKELFEAYKHYRQHDGFTKSLTTQKFGLLLKAQALNEFAKIDSKHTRDGKIWTGLRLKDEYEMVDFGVIKERLKSAQGGVF